MKVLKKVIPTICMLLVVAVLMGTSTYAWFSMNKQVDAKNMGVKASTPSNLVIVKGNDGFTNASSSVDFEETSSTVKELVPITADTDFASGYKYCTNPEAVDTTTGLSAGGELAYADVTANHFGTPDKNYYVDYVVKIAAKGTDVIPHQDLKAKVSFNTATKTQRAVTVAFYIVDASENLTLKGAVNTQNAASTTVTLVENGTIPTENSGYIKVLMRVYIDGALVYGEPATGTAEYGVTYYNDSACTEVETVSTGDDVTGKYTARCYVNTADVNLDALMLSVQFEAVNH